MVTSSCDRIAWHDSRDVGSSPQARSSRSSSDSSISPSELKPWRTTTWQVVQAQLISHACSISMSCSSSASQIDVPGSALISAPFGQYSGCGRIRMTGMARSDFLDAPARERLLDAAVHALGGEAFGPFRECFHGGVDRMVVVAVAHRLHLRQQRVDRAPP